MRSIQQLNPSAHKSASGFRNRAVTLAVCLAEVVRQDLRLHLGRSSDISISVDGHGLVESVNFCCVDADNITIHHSVLGLGATQLKHLPDSVGVDTPKYQKFVSAVKTLVKRFCLAGYVDVGPGHKQCDGMLDAALIQHVEDSLSSVWMDDCPSTQLAARTLAGDFFKTNCRLAGRDFCHEVMSDAKLPVKTEDMWADIHTTGSTSSTHSRSSHAIRTEQEKCCWRPMRQYSIIGRRCRTTIC